MAPRKHKFEMLLKIVAESAKCPPSTVIDHGGAEELEMNWAMWIRAVGYMYTVHREMTMWEI